MNASCPSVLRISLLRTGLIAAAALGLVAGSGVMSSAQREVVDPEEANKECLACHDALLEARTLKPAVKEAHRRHLESQRTEYGGRQRLCTTCHESFRFAPEGLVHPATANEPTRYWRLRINKTEVPGTPSVLPLVAPREPYTFKPTLERLVCVDCHGPDTQIKAFYPARPE